MLNHFRKSWDTNVKHYVRSGLYNSLPNEIKNKIPSSNISRWKNESKDKYFGSDIAQYINQDIELYKRIGQNTKIKNLNEGYFKLVDALHKILSQVNGVKQKLTENKDSIVNIVENLKESISIDKAIKVFGISRATYQNYKTLVTNKCDSSYFLWCVKKYPHQLLKKEILVIKKYLIDEKYSYWSKSSIYLKAIREKSISCGISTWYKYCKLLGFGKRHLQVKKSYKSLKSSKPNEIWCADVTIFKTSDGIKHYIHFLMDHYSKKILGYKIEKSSLAIAIKALLLEAYNKLETQDNIILLTDGGPENVNTTVTNFISLEYINIKHLIAQKDIQFSNSKIEAFNKIIKHQFLLPKHLNNFKQLNVALNKDVLIYNNNRPQLGLAGNTPSETYNNVPLNMKQYTSHFSEHKKNRILQNQKSACNNCTVI